MARTDLGASRAPSRYSGPRSLRAFNLMPLEGGGGIDYNGLRPVMARLCSRPPYPLTSFFLLSLSCSPDFSNHFAPLFIFPSYVVIKGSVLFLFYYFCAPRIQHTLPNSV